MTPLGVFFLFIKLSLFLLPQCGAIATCFLGLIQTFVCLLNELVHGKGILFLLVAQAYAHRYMV